jgi:hypothetical protein
MTGSPWADIGIMLVCVWLGWLLGKDRAQTRANNKMGRVLASKVCRHCGKMIYPWSKGGEDQWLLVNWYEKDDLTDWICTRRPNVITEWPGAIITAGPLSHEPTEEHH